MHWRLILVILWLSDVEGGEIGMWVLGLVTVCLGVIIDCWTGSGCRLIRVLFWASDADGGKEISRELELVAEFVGEIVGCWTGSWCRVVLGDEGGLLAFE